MTQRICETPHNSITAQMGLLNISVGLKVKQTQNAKWDLSVKGYTNLINEVRLEPPGRPAAG